MIKEITVTTKQIMDMMPALSVLANEKFVKNGSLSYRLGRIAKKFIAVRDEFQAEQRKILREKFAELDEKGQFIPDKNDIKYKDKAGFDAAVEEMGKVEEKLTFTPITVAEIEEALGHAPSPATFADLLDIFVDPDSDEAKKPKLEVVN